MKIINYQLSIINYLLLPVWFCTLPLQAQKTAGKDTLLNREMTLEKEYSPTIQSAAKISRLPELREPQAPKSRVEFSDYSTAYEAQHRLASLTPKPMFAGLNASKYAGYASLRLSNILDFDGDAACRILNTGRDLLDIYLSHRSSNSKNPSLQLPSETQPFFMNDHWGGFNFSHGFDNAKLSAGLKYTYSAFNYSGLTVANRNEIPTSFMLETKPIYEIRDYPNQVNNMLEAHAGISSDRPAQLNYKVDLKYTFFKQKYLTPTTPGVRENRIVIDWDLHGNYNLISGFGLSGFYKARKYNSSLSFPPVSVLSLTPYYYMENDNLNLTLGLRADFEPGGSKKNVISPDIRFNFNPSDAFAFYALALGGRNDNSNYNMFYENRYVYPFERIPDSRTYLDGTAGLRYLPVSSLSLDVFAGYRLTEDEHFFFPLYEQTSGRTVMAGNYGTAKVVKLGAQVNYTVQDFWGINVKGTFYNWDVTETATGEAMDAYHKPRFEAGTDVFFRTPNIPLRMDLTFKGLFGRIVPQPSEGEAPQPPEGGLSPSFGGGRGEALDLSVKASYAVTPFFSVNLSANNLLFQKYDIWYGYPAQKFNIMAGISVMF